LLLGDVDAVDARPARALAANPYERFDHVGLSFENRLDGSVGAVCDPTGDAPGVGGASDRPAEADSLDTPVNDEPPADHSAAA